jgi:hypothetical protein
VKSWEFITKHRKPTRYQPSEDAFERKEERAKIDLGRAHAEWHEIVVGTELKQQEMEIRERELELKKQELVLKTNDQKDRDRETVRAMADRTKKRSKKI